MKIIIFAGGTGKRFWPVSRKNSPKQFSPLISGKPLLKLRVETLLKNFKAEDIFISTGIAYSKEVIKMLPELPRQNFILESEMRDTGPAVTLAVTYVHSLFPREKISIQWSDHLIKHEKIFADSLRHSEKMIDEKKKVVFLTVPIRFASPHRGYIKFGDEVKKFGKDISLRKFVKFVEKPSVEIARKYMEKKVYGWNPGYWTLDPEFYLNKIKETSPETYKACKKVVESKFSKESGKDFSKLERISADYMFAENVKSAEAYALISDFGWSDVGEWIALKEALQENDEANVIRGNVFDHHSKDTIIFNLEDSKMISTIGLEGMVVVNTKDVLAVFKKEDNTKLKEYLEKLEKEGKGEYL